MTRRALITGITGQDGSYLAELLLGNDSYEVHGVVRRSSSLNTGRIDHIFDKLHLHHGDVTDASSMRRVMEKARPDEVYHLAAQSHVRVSFDEPEYTLSCGVMGTMNVLEAVRAYQEAHGLRPDAVRVYQASSSEMFGSEPGPQNEHTPFKPCSPYGVAKVAAHHLAVHYRDAYGMWVACGILFNHESARRGETFVTRKITRAAARISLGLQDTLSLGNLKAVRDWGFAGDYVKAMHIMLAHDRPRDYVIATGHSHSVEEFLGLVFGQLGLKVNKHVVIDGRLRRPAEVNFLQGDPDRAKDELGWSHSVGLASLVNVMIEHDLDLARRELVLRAGGFKASP